MSLFMLSSAPARRPQLAHPLAAVAAMVARRVRRFVTGWRHRRDAAVLSRADERVLADLGLSRGDLNDAFSGPPWEDPTTLLRARALERRLRRHHVSHGFVPPSLAPLSAPADADRRPIAPGKPQ
jgi:uncharacterized protein YjiS (DUF1127 family)